MRKLFFFIIFGIVIVTSAPCYAVDWAITYSGGMIDRARFIDQTTDGGYFTGGSTNSNDNTTSFWWLKLNPEGTIVWQKSDDGADVSIAWSGQHTSDGGYIIAGITDPPGEQFDCLVLKLNSNGSIAWQKTYGTANIEFLSSIQQTGDGGYIIVGWTGERSDHTEDAFVIKLDSYGDIIWQKTYDTGENDRFFSIRQTKDQGYIVAGHTLSSGWEDDIWIIKLNGDGNVLWQKLYGGLYNDNLNDIQQTEDGGYVLAGKTDLYGTGSSDCWVLKLDSVGNIEWQKAYGLFDSDKANTDEAASIKQTSDGGFIVAGNTASYWGGGWNFLLLKLNLDGSIDWQKTYGTVEQERVDSILQTNDGGYIMQGVLDLGAGHEDLMVIKVNENGEIPNCNIINNTSAVVTNTNATARVTNATTQQFSAIVSNKNLSVIDTSAQESVICYFPDTIEVNIDIIPRTCPNECPIKGGGSIEVAILGKVDFDVNDIDIASVRLEGVTPIRSRLKDKSSPVVPPPTECECTAEGRDGFIDLCLKFDKKEILSALGEVDVGDSFVLTLTGSLNDGTPIEGRDCIVMTQKGKKN